MDPSCSVASVSTEVQALLALHLIPGLGPRLTAALLDRFGSAAAVLQATAAELQQVPHIGPKLGSSFHEALRQVHVAAELDRLAKYRVRLLVLGTPEYPPMLATIPDPPHLLYIRGNLDPRDANAVALVGSRQCTSYGRRMAERLAGGLARAGYTVISGLAYGIDAASHRGALQAKGRTLAVLAGGLSRIYPSEHTDLAEEVTGSGALLTEAAMSQEPLPAMFPARNRLISGLSRAVVVVEAHARSGALITATHASEQGREVFAVPGSVDSPASAGALHLLRQGARLVRSAEDILEELQGIAPLVSAPPPSAPNNLSPLQQRIWDLLGGQPRHIDEITRETATPITTISQELMLMEMNRLVRRLPGNQYERRDPGQMP